MKNWILAVGLTLFASPTFAFVENVTHGYPNCMACHVSPSGGGTLTDYGRSLSKELMSTWSWENSEQVLFGVVPPNERLKIGGDVRWIQSHFEDDSMKRGRNFLMQQNIELAYNIAKTWIVGTFGISEGPKGTPDKGQFTSERHYVLSELSDGVFVRAGKFRTTFGVNDPNHNRFTRGPLQLGAGSETYNLEVSKFLEDSEFFLSAGLGRLDTPRENRSEKNFNLTYAKYFKEKNKIGTSFLLGESLRQRRSLLGVYGVLALPFESTFVGEVDFQRSHLATNASEKIDGLYTHAKWMFEVYKGVKPYLIVEHRQNNLKDQSTKVSGSGLGLQWLPIPHIEFQMEYQRVADADSAWLLSHYYF